MLRRLAQKLTRPFTQGSLRRRMWKGGGMLGVFLLTMLIGNHFVTGDRAVTRELLGHDFLAFYFGGTCLRTGQLDKLYNLDETRAFELKTGAEANLEFGKDFSIGPWWNPPFAAILFLPFTFLAFKNAVMLWWILGIACAAIASIIMGRMLPAGWKNRLLVPLLLVVSMPFFQTFSHGQNTYFSLLLLTITVALWRSQRALAAGIVCGLLFYKPQLGAVVAVVLCLSQGRKAFVGVAATGLCLLLLNMVFMPGTLDAWRTQLAPNLRWMQEANHYMWERHATFKAFWRLLIQGRDYGPDAISVDLLWAACEAALLAGLGLTLWKNLRGPRTASKTDRLIAATLVSMPLLMPFYFDYDLLLISIAAVLYAADRLATPSDASQWEHRWLPRFWILLFLTQEAGSALAGHVRLHPMVPLLAAIAVGLIQRSLRSEAAEAIVEMPEESPLLARAA